MRLISNIMSLRVYTPVHKRCKYCNIEYKTKQEVFMVKDRSFCSEDHRDLYMESQWDITQNPEIIVMKPKVNNFLKKSPSMVSSTSLQEFFEIREKPTELCPCIIM